MTPITKPYLRRLRNQVDLRRLMIEVLDLEHRHTGGRFRFLCPQCQEFNTAVNPATNLGRCFTCLKNFNPIDLVILVKHYDFLQAVDFLDRFLPDEPAPGPSSAGAQPP
jgi:DNA primase